MPRNGNSRPKSFFCPQQFRKMIVKVPENRPGRCSKTPENLPVLSRVIFNFTEDFALEKKGSLVGKLSGEVPEVCTGTIF